MTEAAPTLDELGVSGDVEKILAEAAEVVTTPDERWSNASNVVRYGEKKLPERVTVYRRLTGRAVEVPTATIGQSLRKKAPDGGPAFVRTKAEAVTPPPFIEQECEVCVQHYGKPKRFYTMANYRGHMRGMHGQEWDEMRETAAEERQNRQTAALIALAEKGITNASEEVSEEADSGRAEGSGGEFVCGDCGQGARSQAGLQAHQRAKHQLSELPVA